MTSSRREVSDTLVQPIPTDAPATDGGSRRARKRRDIIQAATRVFLRDGFAGASVDAIAAEARVSKPTLYTHFGNKEALFRAILTAILEERVRGFASELERPLGQTDDLEIELTRVGRAWARSILQPDVIALRRLVIGEMERFPELGRVWFEAGPGRVDRARTEQFADLTARGRLRLDDPALAAQHFGHLIVGQPQMLLLFKARESFSDEEIDEFVRAGVAVFLSHYGVDAGVESPKGRRMREHERAEAE